MAEVDALKAKIDRLSPTGVRFVHRLVDAIGRPPQVSLGVSWLTIDPRWAEHFGFVLTAHHGTTTEPLTGRAFEIGFRDACTEVGWQLSPSCSPTQRFVDLCVVAGDGRARRLSLKTTSAGRLAPTTVHISKLTEAAWIQDVRSPTPRQTRTVELFRAYRAAVDAIVMLRAFRGQGAPLPVRYQLIEIPSEIFGGLDHVPRAAFEGEGPTIDCPFRDHPRAARVYLDRSDAKITVKDIQLSVCTVHATWVLGEAAG